MLESSLTSTVQALRDGLPEMARQIAEELGDMMRDKAAEYTPIGRQIDMESGEDRGPSGKLKASWKRDPVEGDKGRANFTVRVHNDVDYALYVNDGTKPHVIPKGGSAAGIILRFHSHGELLYRAKVHHPGTKGHFMVQRAQAATEREWKAKAESRIKIAIEQAERKGNARAKREF